MKYLLTVLRLKAVLLLLFLMPVILEIAASL